MSEYAAAVGLALLDHWPEFRIRYISVLYSYRKHFAAAHNTGRFWLEPNWITTYPHVITRSEFRTGSADADIERCADRQPPLVDGRMSQHACLSERPRLPLPIPTNGSQPLSACRFRSTSTMRKSAISPARRYRFCRMQRRQAAVVYPGGPRCERRQVAGHYPARATFRSTKRRQDPCPQARSAARCVERPARSLGEALCRHRTGIARFHRRHARRCDLLRYRRIDRTFCPVCGDADQAGDCAGTGGAQFCDGLAEPFLEPRAQIAGDFMLLNVAASEAVAVEHLAINLYGAGEHTKALQRTGRSEGASSTRPTLHRQGPRG